MNGWPDRITKVPRIARQFWGARDELLIEEGLLMKGNCICIPLELYDRSLHELHEMHLGIEKMQHRARATLYWPGIDMDIVEYEKRCKTCTQHKATQHIEPMLPRDVPEAPWQDLAADFFNFKGKEYLVIADTFSKYPFAFRMTTKTADTVIQKFTQLFSQYGNPKSLTTDNGPPFSSEDFAQFMSTQRVEHITSSPHYPKCNGFIGRQVKTMKTALATVTTSGKTLDDVLLSLRSSPIGPNLPSPREILHNCTEEHPGQPSHPVDYEQVRNYLLGKKATQKEYHDKSHNTKPLSELEPGQKILFLSPREENQYIEGTITTKAAMPRNYYIECQCKTYCCTCQHICTTNIENPVSQDHQQEIVPVSEDHQESQHHRDKHVSQDHHHSHRVTVSQDHQQKYRHKQSKKLITGPQQPPNSMDQLLQYLAVINGHSNLQLAQMNPDITPTPGTPKSTSSEDSSPSSSQTSPSYNTEEEETSDDESIASTTRDRQLRP